MGTTQGTLGSFTQSRSNLGGRRGGNALPMPVSCPSGTLGIHLCVDTFSPRLS